MEKQGGKRYPKEVCDKVVRIIDGHQSEYPSQWAYLTSIADKFGMAPKTLRRWVKTTKSTGQVLASGLTTAEQMKPMKREIKELGRSNEILKRAAVFFGAKLNCQQK